MGSNQITSNELDALVEHNVHEGVEPLQHTVHLPAPLKLHPHPLVQVLLQVEDCSGRGSNRTERDAKTRTERKKKITPLTYILVDRCN